MDGLYYQWGRPTPFKSASSGVYGAVSKVSSNPAQVATVEEAAANPTTLYGSGDGMRHDWLATKNNALWGYQNEYTDLEKTMYDPCPIGWKVPESKVWNGMKEATDGAFEGGWYFDVNDQITFYPAAGRRSFSKGVLTNVNHDGTPYTGYYWSSTTTSSDKSVGMYFNIDNVDAAQANYRAGGFQIRCVKE
jgi:uncharacterized protein (TIGR02145 family)